MTSQHVDGGPKTLQVLGFDDTYVKKVIAVLVQNPIYLTTISDAIDPLYFDNIGARWIIEKLLEYNSKYSTKPGTDYFTKEIYELKQLNDPKVPLIRALMNEVYFMETHDFVEYIQDSFTQFCSQQAWRQGIFTAVDMIKMGREADVPKLMAKIATIGHREVLGHDYKHDVETRYNRIIDKIIPLPFDEYNSRMSEGGLMPGNLCLVMGPGGGGKTWFIINWMNKLADMGMNVLHFNLESEFYYVGKRYDANRLGIPTEQCGADLDRVKEAISTMPGNIHVKDLTGDQRCLPYMQRYIDYLFRETGFYPDVVVIDFIKRMKTGGKNAAEHINQADLLKEIIDFGKEGRFPVISPSPINREGSDDVKVIKEKHIAGTFEAIFDADLIFSWSKFYALHWIKNKNGSAKHTDQLDYNEATGQFLYVGDYIEDDKNVMNDRDKAIMREKLNLKKQLETPAPAMAVERKLTPISQLVPQNGFNELDWTDAI